MKSIIRIFCAVFLSVFAASIGTAQASGSLNQLRSAAEQGDAAAQYHYGAELLKEDGELAAREYANGNIGEDDPLPAGKVKSLPWLQKAAAQGYPDAIATIGEHYIYGDIVARDTAKGFEMLRHGIELGSTEGMYALAIMYQEGMEIEQNPTKALVMYGNAAARGHKGALESIKAKAESGHPLYQFQLAEYYREGKVLPQDSTRAYHFYYESAKKNFAPSLVAVYLAWAQGDGVEKNQERAEYFRQFYEKHPDQNTVNRYFTMRGENRP
ncbi:tetratricopeptide repeat protein [Aestuariispira ectoiniformans]|uniref:tetratricopeptide repeat protein n=1 Tax=Aestuariispira ectoiniformans TaxID=2775080 RepID=UPI00223AA980|nr:tetratricopeptide repeat protein [Aestuariispira ectoiniformans]